MAKPSRLLNGCEDLLKHRVSLLSDRYPRIRDVGAAMTGRLWSHPDQCLDWHVFLYVNNGRLQVWEDDTEFYLEPGDVLFLKKGVRHWGEMKTEAGTSWFWIHFLESGPEENPVQENVIYLPKTMKTHQPQYIEHKMKKLLELYKSQIPLRTIMLSINTAQLFIELLQQSIKEKKMTKMDMTVNKITEVIESHADSKFNSRLIAEALNLNYNYLSTVFKDKMGMSISEYHTMIRIRKAMELLKDSRYNISEVSEKLGFSNPYHFSSVFKKSVGVSPSQYIKQVYR